MNPHMSLLSSIYSHLSSNVWSKINLRWPHLPCEKAMEAAAKERLDAKIQMAQEMTWRD